MKRLLVMVAALIVAFGSLPPRSALAHGPGDCPAIGERYTTRLDSGWEENGVHRLFGRISTRIGVTGDLGRGASVWMKHQVLYAEDLGHRNHVQRTLWLWTDDGRLMKDRWWVEVARRKSYDPARSTKRIEGWFWQRSYVENNYDQYEAGFNGSVPNPDALGGWFRLELLWDAGVPGYKAYVTVNNTRHVVKTLPGNGLDAWRMAAGGESNHCTGGDGDSQYNRLDTALTDSWSWIDDDGQRHYISSPGLGMEPPMHAWWDDTTNQDSACFHFIGSGTC